MPADKPRRTSKETEPDHPDEMSGERPGYDPGFLQTRREALAAVLIWFLALCWVVPFSYAFGYRQPTNSADLSMTLGMPTWVFWGVAVPWVVCSLAGIAICVWFIREEKFDEPASEEM